MRSKNFDLIPPTGPVILIANHNSHLDPPGVGINCARTAAFMARASLFRVPLLGWTLRQLNSFPIDRDKSATAGIKASLQQLEEGKALIMFPEGTRSPDGKLQDLKRGILLLLKKYECPVYVIGIAGSFDAFPKGKIFPRPKRIRFYCSEWKRPDDYSDSNAVLHSLQDAMQNTIDQAGQL